MIYSLTITEVSNSLILIGLLFDAIGAILLIGPNFSPVGKFGARLWPNLRLARDGYNHLMKEGELTRDHPGFKPLAEIYQGQERDWFPNWSSAVNEPLRFEIDFIDNEPIVDFTYEGGTQTITDIEIFDRPFEQKIERTYHMWGAILLLGGFAIQFVAVAIFLLL